MQNTSPTPQAAQRAWFWPTAIIVLLCVHAVSMVVVVFIATRDPSFSVEPNSYKLAVAWDSSQVKRRASEQLGWSASIQTSVNTDPFARRRISCRITDKDGVPVMAANVRLEVFHHARAADRVQVSLNPQQDGVYSTELPMKRAGTWEFRITADRGSESFSTVVTQQVGSTT